MGRRRHSRKRRKPAAPRLRLPGIRLEEPPKRRKKKLLKIPVRGVKLPSAPKKPKKALLKLPVKVKSVYIPDEPEYKKKPFKLEVEALSPQKMEEMLQKILPLQKKKLEKHLRQKKYSKAWPIVKGWILRPFRGWDWKAASVALVLILVTVLGVLISYKVYDSLHGWEEDARNIEVTEEVFTPQYLPAEDVIDAFREKVNREYAAEIGNGPRRTPSSSRPSPSPSPSPTTSRTPKYVRTGASTTSGKLDEYVLRKFLSDANLYRSLPGSSNFQIGFYGADGEPIQSMFYYVEGGFLAQGRNRGAEFYIYFPVEAAGQLAQHRDPCALVTEIYNRKAYQFIRRKGKTLLRQKYAGLMWNIRDCSNR